MAILGETREAIILITDNNDCERLAVVVFVV